MVCVAINSVCIATVLITTADDTDSQDIYIHVHVHVCIYVYMYSILTYIIA